MSEIRARTLGRLLIGPLVTCAAIGLVAAASTSPWAIPSPTGFLLLFVIYAAFMGGWAPSAISAVLVLIFLLVFFYNGDQPPYYYTFDEAKRIGLWLVTAPASVWLVGWLRRQLVNTNHEAWRAATLELFSHTLDAAIGMDREGNVLGWNASAERKFGWLFAEVEGRPMADFIIPARFRKAHRDGLVHFRRNKTGPSKVIGKRLEMVALRRDGTEFDVELVVNVIYKEEYKGGYFFFASLRDISAQKAAEEALQRSERELADFFDNASLSLHWVNQEGLIIRANKTELSLLGYEAEEYIGKSEDLFHADPALAKDMLRRLAQGEVLHDHPAILRRKDGSLRHVLIDSNVRWEDGKFVHTRCITRDISNTKRLEETLLYNAFHDSLTGLANRALFLDRLAQCLRAAKKRHDRAYAVLFIDLDRFKLVNDSLGHIYGDQLLVETARRLERFVRPGDTVARFGGDEFTVLLENVGNGEGASGVAERIQLALQEPLRLGNQEVFPSASIGIALSRDTYMHPEDVIRDADAAMYRAKAHGPSRSEVFDAAMHRSALALLQTETDLRHGLERGELRVVYQPVVSLATGALLGFEALVRWQHPTRGLLSPVDFIRIAEDAGLVIDVDRWVLHEASAQMKRWLAATTPPPHGIYVNVNLSAKQFTRSDIIAEIQETLITSSIDKNRLNLEITESAFMENNGIARATLRQLSELGMALYLDDFGTGYSSLSYLHQFPINAVKVDRSFVIAMRPDSNELVLVRAIINMAHALNMTVVAEGVETAEQVLLLRDLGCDAGQGYFFSRPVGAEEAEAMLQRTWASEPVINEPTPSRGLLRPPLLIAP